MLTESNDYGDEKYVVSLKGPYDGVQVEFIHYSDRGQVVAEFYDEETRELMESVKVDISYLNPKVREDRSIVMDMAEGFSNRSLYDHQTEDLLRLASWWLSQGFVPRVWNGEELLVRDDDNYQEIMTMVNEQRTDDFLGGEKVRLLDGLTVQVEMTDTSGNTMDGSITIRDKDDKDWAWVEGEITEGLDQEVEMEIISWGSRFSAEDDSPALRDVLAFTKRYLISFYKKVEIIQEDLPVEMDEYEVAERTYYWLGF